jgi:hypothetical protein
MHKLAMLIVLSSTIPALAQQAPPSPERQNAMVQALIAQRDDQANRVVICSADAADLNKQIADLKAKLEAKEEKK